MPFFITMFAVLAIVAAFLAANIRVVPQTQVFVIERLGQYLTTWEAGLHVKLPFVDNIVARVSIKEQVLDFPPQSVITKDNVVMQIDSIVFMKVMDAKLFTYGAADPVTGIESLAATTLRNLVGGLNFDETLTSRELINADMERTLDEATDPWGIKVTRVEVKDIQPPKDIQAVMAKQMKAEREKRQAILEAEAHRQSVIARAEGDKQAKVLAAEADRDAAIAVAEGRAKSIQMVYEAEAAGLRRLSDIDISAQALQLKQLEALKAVADGNSTKIFIPSDITGAVVGAGTFGEALETACTDAAPKLRPIPPKPVDHCLTAESSRISRNAATEAGYDTNFGVPPDAA